MPPLTFHLTSFDSIIQITQPSLGAGQTLTDVTGHDVTLEVEVALSAINGNFMYKVDATNISTNDGVEDISFKTVGNCCLSADVTTIVQATNSTSTSGIGTYNLTQTTSLGNTEYNSIGTEFVLYLANTIFGDSGAHRYFSNEAAIVDEIDVTLKFVDDAAASGMGVFKNVTLNGHEQQENALGVGVKNQGLAFEIWQHIIQDTSEISRLTNEVEADGGTNIIVGTAGDWNQIPIKVGDIFQVKQVIQCADSLGVEIGDRAYLINYTVV